MGAELCEGGRGRPAERAGREYVIGSSGMVIPTCNGEGVLRLLRCTPVLSEYFTMELFRFHRFLFGVRVQGYRATLFRDMLKIRSSFQPYKPCMRAGDLHNCMV